MKPGAHDRVRGAAGGRRRCGCRPSPARTGPAWSGTQRRAARMPSSAGRDIASRHIRGTACRPGMSMSTTPSLRCGVARREQGRHHGPHRVAHQRDRAGDVLGLEHRVDDVDVVGEQRIAPRARCVRAETGQVDRDHPVADRERRHDPVPGREVVGEPVQQDQRVRALAGDGVVDAVDGQRVGDGTQRWHGGDVTQITHRSHAGVTRRFPSVIRPPRAAGIATGRGPGSPSTRTAAATPCCR